MGSACLHAITEIHRHDPIERFGGDLRDGRVAARDADADVVVQYIHAAPSLDTIADGGRDALLVSDIRLERGGFAAFRADQISGFPGRGGAPVDRQHSGALPREEQRGGASVPHGRSRCLAGAENDSHFSLESHATSPLGNAPGQS